MTPTPTPPPLPPSPAAQKILESQWCRPWPEPSLRPSAGEGAFTALLQWGAPPGERWTVEAGGSQEPADQEDSQQIEERAAPSERVADPCAQTPVLSSEAKAEVTAGVIRAPQGELQEPALQVIAQQLLKGLVVHQLERGTELHLELNARRFSRLGLDLRLIRGRIEARFTVADELDVALLRSAVGELPAELQGRGLPLEGVKVDLESGARQGERQPRAPDHRLDRGRASKRPGGRPPVGGRADAINYEV